MARSYITVIVDTKTMTKASTKGILCMIRNEDQANVPITTINITPMRAAMGIISIRGAATTIKKIRKNAAEIPDRRWRAPELILIML